MTSLTSYITGYVLSLLLTIGAAGILELHFYTHHTFPTHEMLTVLFVALALVQLVVQLYFFLHVGKGQNKHWNMAALGFALFVIAILVGGTLWIMHNLQSRMVTGNPYIGNQIQVQDEDD